MEYSVLLPTRQEFCQYKVFNNVLYLNIWHKFSLYLAEKLDLLVLTSKSVMFGFDDIQD